ncbi:MAG: hypothetical protein KKE20_03140 [Nanoarchaeota archaeon]|nr:hypothetical protein [Nanoarchaeota archaeon]
MNRCMICKEMINHPQRTRCCARVRCRIVFSYYLLKQKGYDPEMYYAQIIDSKKRVLCKKCGKEFIARFKRDLFFPVCKECEHERFWSIIEELEKEALDEACKFFLPSEVFDMIRKDRK